MAIKRGRKPTLNARCVAAKTRLTPKEYRIWSEYANQMNCSLSHFVRKAVTFYVACMLDEGVLKEVKQYL